MFPLRIRSSYSLMRGTMSPADICARAREFGHDGVALTDRDNLYGLWPFLTACRREKLKAIIGCELTEPKTMKHITCLVKDQQGYANLCTLISRRHCQNDFDLAAAAARYGRGLLFLCGDIELLQSLLALGLAPVADVGPQPTQRAAALRRWAQKKGLRCTASHDASIGEQKEADLYMLLRAIDGNLRLSEAEQLDECRRISAFEPDHVYRRRFAVWPEVVRESFRVAAECGFRGPDFGLVMPPWSGGDPTQTLRKKAYRGAQRRYGRDLGEAVVERLEHELDIIDSMGFSSYFLVVRDIVHRRGPDGRRKKRRICGRGSGAASLVAYCLEITNVCPLKYNLYFERFLNPGRSDPPDIDIDFSWDERDEVLAEVLGEHRGHAAMVSNHIFFKPRMAIRETAKTCGMPGREISRVTKKIPWMHRPGSSLAEQLKHMPSLKNVELDDPWPMIIGLAQRLIGLPRYISVHPGGVIITPQAVSTYVPVEMAPKGVPIIQWEKDGTEEAGLVKIDLLGNRSLGVIRDCIAAVRQAGGDFIEEGWQPEDDPPTRATVACGATMGCFYIESPAMRLLQRKAGSGDYEQLVIQSSIIRPAANEFVREYVRRLHGGSWQPLHGELNDVLDETFGLMVYQEDVSRVAVQLAGFSHVRADGLRKVMSKKDKARRLADYRQEFFRGCSAKNIDESRIEAIWSMMMSFDGYSFCKPHSASYARVSFQAAYLKTHYPAEFMAAVISNQGGYYSTFAYVSEARRCGVAILPPDVNASTSCWKSESGAIRVGLEAVSGLSQKCLQRICCERDHHGPFRSAIDFFLRAEAAEDEARNLIHCGALDSLEPQANRIALLWELARFRRTRAAASNMPLFKVRLPPVPHLPPPDPMDMLRREYEVLGFVCAAHPVILFENRVPSRTTSVQLPQMSGRHVCFLGWLLSGKLVSTKTGEAMEFLTFEDEFGLVEATFFPRIYRRYAHLLSSGKPYVLHGLVETDHGAATLTVDRVAALEKV